MFKPDRKPYVPEARKLFGPGVGIWQAREDNSAERTDHDALIADKARRRRIAERLLANAQSQEANEPKRS